MLPLLLNILERTGDGVGFVARHKVFSPLQERTESVLPLKITRKSYG